MSAPRIGLTTPVREALRRVQPGEGMLLPWPADASKRSFAIGVSAVASQLFGTGRYTTRSTGPGVRVNRLPTARRA